jgi:hypothetical protein
MTPGLDAVFFLFENTRRQSEYSQFEKFMGEIDRDPAVSRKLLILYGDSTVSGGRNKRSQSAMNLRKRLKFLRDQIRLVKETRSIIALSISMSQSAIAPAKIDLPIVSGQFSVPFPAVILASGRDNPSFEVRSDQ